MAFIWFSLGFLLALAIIALLALFTSRRSIDRDLYQANHQQMLEQWTRANELSQERNEALKTIADRMPPK